MRTRTALAALASLVALVCPGAIGHLAAPEIVDAIAAMYALEVR